MNLLKETLAKIEELDQSAVEKCQERLDSLTKPPGSLGVLEVLAKQLAGITGEVRPKIEKKAVIVMAGDHGIVAEGVSAFPQEVTPQMVFNFINGGAAINVLSNHVGAEVEIVDVGVAAEIDHPKLLKKKIRMGTDNMAEGPVMSEEEAVKALEVGILVAKEKIEQGVNLLATGDMGIGNTTPSSAILAVASGVELEGIVGRGTGVDDEGLKVKVRAIKKALDVNKPNAKDGLDLLHKVGGFEIGAIAGVILGAAANRVPVIIDGFISGAGAIIAAKLEPKAAQYMIPSHASVEPGHKLMLELLSLKPMLQMDMRLGEGTGAALAMNLVEAAAKIVDEMATFEEAGVASGE